MDTSTKIATGNDKASYPSHKTIVLIEEKVIEKKIESTPISNSVKSVENKNSTVSDNKSAINVYPAHKTFTLTEEKAVEKKIESTPVPNLIKSVEKTPVNTASSDNKTVVNSYLSHKTVVINTESVKPLTDVVKKEADIQKDIKLVSEPKTDINAIKTPATDKTVVTTGQQNQLKENYSVHKTVVLENQTINKELVNVVNSTVEPLSTNLKTSEVQPPSVSEITSSITNKPIENNLKNSYPAHKTFSFSVSEELVNKAVDEKIVAASTKTTIPTVDNKATTSTTKVSTSSVETKQQELVAKTKKPILWIVASAVFVLTSAATIWYTNYQKSKLENELTSLKQTNAELLENVQKLQKELYIDDIIARSGVVDAKNNIVVQQDALKSEVIRTCFSVIPNKTAKTGKKIVYIRLLDSNGNVLSNNTNNSFDYKGSKIEYTIKKEVDFKGQELMLCVDYKLEKKLETGSYKAELYNDGVLDGVSLFELK